ncbi:SAM hydrolase/SAM-dependent halogenase family protein [Desulfogranum japonicum]|uniref:SAM hydrolase/SAM-dependent halogenase family protein n=1 Tax=Desulfogranum japonicum TaxID=231447 RepID=UPI00040366DC|nr:SAM-dependent chlorinase/fluorinase [Desulfogranum japonicum]
MKSLSIVTLITDFGLEDPYVGQLKGALLSIARDLCIVDITHAIQPHDITGAGYALSASYIHFPAGTVHLAVVDPGVGSDRNILIAEGNGHVFVCPDNGILSPLVEQETIERVYAASYGQAKSHTFHGRDIMAPLAGRIARGEPCEKLGQAMALDACVRCLPRQVKRKGQLVIGHVVRIDHFGNIRTSLRGEEFGDIDAEVRWLTIRKKKVSTFCRTYAEIPSGETAFLIDSDGFIEVAANQCKAVSLLDVTVGDEVVCKLRAL